MQKLLAVESGHLLKILYQEVSDLNAFLCMDNCLLVFVHLGKQSADLHVGLAHVLEQLQPQRREGRVIEVLLEVGAFLKVHEAGLQAERTVL